MDLNNDELVTLEYNKWLKVKTNHGVVYLKLQKYVNSCVPASIHTVLANFCNCFRDESLEVKWNNKRIDSKLKGLVVVSPEPEEISAAIREDKIIDERCIWEILDLSNREVATQAVIDLLFS